ncbi:MAG: DUF1841 family protein [Betaproteobacteria bacterium]|nr:DUF1841 family protein [Betaproteobacteria bacterium]
MFDPTREQVRETFFGAWRKYRAGEPLVGIEAVAVDVVLAHPEYHAILDDPERHRERDYVDEGNPFLHMSLHMALEEQLSIDQPPGIAARFAELVRRAGERHGAVHEAIECLAETIWRAQRNNAPPDGDAYLACLERRPPRR